jgi:4-aminobutyrate aminotransferase-like enzyme
VTASLTDTRSAELYRRALNLIPGGVNSPVRAMRAIGRNPIFVDRGEGAELLDVDGNRYVDYVCSWGGADPRARPPAGARRGRRGHGEGNQLRRADTERG